MSPGPLRALVAALLCLAVAAPASAQDAPPCEPLTLRERVAQTVMTAIPGTRMDAFTQRLVTRFSGSVLLMGHNVSRRAQLRSLTRALHRAGEIRPLVAVDEEGGRVARLGEDRLVVRLPSARTMARTFTVARVRRLATRLGREMRRLGVDWDLAPVLDVTGAPDRTVIGDRSFGDRPRRVVAYGRAFAQGLGRGGVLATGKHFPGHGRTALDSHRTLPTVRASLGSLRRRDLVPYVRSRWALDAVMTAHVRFTALDRRRPASLSRRVTELLREEIGFQGVLVTDDLMMGAIANRWTPPVAAELALRAGSDMVLVTSWRAAKPVAQRLLQAARGGRLAEGRLGEAVGRVLALKGMDPAEIDCLLGVEPAPPVTALARRRAV